jgi:VanZ family protein
LLPSPSSLPTTGWDKTNHLLGFFLLSLLGLRAYPSRAIVVLLGLLMYGGMIEVLQSFTPDRFAELADLIADGLGLIAGWVTDVLYRKLRKNDNVH